MARGSTTIGHGTIIRDRDSRVIAILGSGVTIDLLAYHLTVCTVLGVIA